MNIQHVILPVPQVSTDVNSTQIALSVSFDFHNKDSHHDAFKPFSYFKPVQWSLDKLVSHVTSGRAISWGYLREDSLRNDDNVERAELVALDFDKGVSVEQALNNPYIENHAFLVYATPTSTIEIPRCRALFRLETAIRNQVRFKDVIKALQGAVAYLLPDEGVSSFSQVLFGCDTQDYHVMKGNILDDNSLDHLLSEYAGDKASSQAGESVQSSTSNGGKVGKLPPALMVEAIEAKLNVVFGTKRNRLYSECFRCPMVDHQHDNTHPRAMYHKTKGFVRCFKCGETYNLWDVAEAIGIDWNDYYSLGNEYQDKFKLTPDVELNTRYVSLEDICPNDAPLAGVKLIKSPMGSNKTGVAVDVVEQAKQTGKRILVVTHRVALSENLVRRFGLHHYQRIERPSDTNQIVVCINSLSKVLEADLHYDIVIIDEVEQVLESLFNKTFRGRDGFHAYTDLQWIIEDAQLVLCLDAYASQVSHNWLCCIRHDVQVIENSYQTQHEILTTWTNFDAILYQTTQLVSEEKGAVVILVNRVTEANQLYGYFIKSQGLDPTDVELVCGENREQPEIQRFIQDINECLPKRRVLIATPVLGTGVNITAPVRAVIGLYFHQPLTAPECMQMLGRCRIAQERHVWLQGINQLRQTDVTVLKRDILKTHQPIYANRKRTSSGGSTFDLSSESQAFLQLQAEIMANRNASFNQRTTHFKSLAHQLYRVANNSVDEIGASKEEWEYVRQEYNEQYEGLVVGNITADDLRNKGFPDISITILCRQANLAVKNIERVYLQPPTAKILKHYNRGKGVAKLYLFMRVMGYDEAHYIARYCSTNTQDMPIAERIQNYKDAPAHRLCHSVLDGLFKRDGQISTDHTITLAEVDQFMHPFVKRNDSNLRVHLNWHGKLGSGESRYKNVMTTVLRAMGLTVRKSRDVDEYSLHDGQLAEMIAYADMVSEVRQGKAKYLA